MSRRCTVRSATIQERFSGDCCPCGASYHSCMVSRVVAQHQAGTPRAPDVRTEVIRAFKRIGADTNLVEDPGTAATENRAQDARVSPCQYPGMLARKVRIGPKHTLAREPGGELNAPRAVRSKLYALAQLLKKQVGVALRIRSLLVPRHKVPAQRIRWRFDSAPLG